jgi:hypothetical protein
VFEKKEEEGEMETEVEREREEEWGARRAPIERGKEKKKDRIKK